MSRTVIISFSKFNETTQAAAGLNLSNFENESLGGSASSSHAAAAAAAYTAHAAAQMPSHIRKAIQAKVKSTDQSNRKFDRNKFAPY